MVMDAQPDINCDLCDLVHLGEKMGQTSEISTLLYTIYH